MLFSRQLPPPLPPTISYPPPARPPIHAPRYDHQIGWKQLLSRARPLTPIPQSDTSPPLSPSPPPPQKNEDLYKLDCSGIFFHTELVFLNVYGAQESIPRNEFRQSM
jgi:hypothetical protein